MDKQQVSPSAISLVGLAVEYSRLVEAASETEPHQFLRDILRYLPRFYITLSDIAGSLEYEPEESDAVYQIVTEESYDTAREAMAAVFGQYDVYLDTPADDMRYSDTPVGVSLAEQLADLYQNFSDFAATVQQIPAEMIPETVAEMVFRFKAFMSETICSALRAANYLYQNNVLEDQE